MLITHSVLLAVNTLFIGHKHGFSLALAAAYPSIVIMESWNLQASATRQVACGCFGPEASSAYSLSDLPGWGSEQMGNWCCCRHESPCGSLEERSGLLTSDSKATQFTGCKAVAGNCGPEGDDCMRWDDWENTDRETQSLSVWRVLGANKTWWPNLVQQTHFHRISQQCFVSQVPP